MSDGPAADDVATDGGQNSWFANYFGFAEHGTDLRTEIVAGITTFLTMSYIVVVNPAIMTQFPGPNGKPGIAIEGYTPGEVQQMLAVVTILAAAAAIFVMAFYANRPFGQAPGLGLNAFFAFTVVGAMGVPWQTALAAVVTEGVLFILLTAVGARKYIIELFPEPVKFAVGTGIGLFLAIIGLEAMRIVVDDPETLVTLGPIATDPVAILSVIGLFLTLMLYVRGLKGAIVIGILATAIMGAVATLAGLVEPGVAAADFVRNGGLDMSQMTAAQYDITPLFGAFLDGFANVDAFAFSLVVFTFFFVDFFDTAGTLTGVSQVAGFLDDKGNLPEIEKPLMADAIGTTVGGILGTSTVTTYIESSTGVEEGGRTGMTALVVGLLFLAALIVVPLAAAIPLYASHIALVVVALLMLQNVTDIQWDDLSHAVPAGMIILIMPLTYSISYGIAAGIISYPLVKAAQGEWRDVHVGQWLLAAAFVVYFAVRTSGVLTTVA
ncbi:putative MFS transporter, AGZA family, xanthine/uracil permease [Halorientalis persicus]|uniref:Putative MFS transporter, AGZA family, xanthine/uracil permease n=1 Tax=Halorientalis persicus TaxID=1367881 RepID=A0A1H8I426_9EURY|nr:NCS2 family permease [Halorientalis persicus]SEN63092.1 putative MFS transporter, AGZA family, xanthine/uracil permease [Halorientalis persicus]